MRGSNTTQVTSKKEWAGGALVKLSVPPLGHHGPVAAVDPRDLVALDLPHRVLGAEPGEGDGEVVAQRQDLPALVREVVDQLAVLPVLACGLSLTW